MLLRKMLRDMRLHKVQFISIFLMSLLGVFVYTGINAEWHGMQKEADRYYEDTALADFWIVGSGFSAEDVSAAAALPGAAAAQRRLTIDGTAVLGGSPALRVNVLDENTLSRPLAVEGRQFDTALDGVWLDSAFARANGLKTGDTLAVSLGGSRIEKTILGLVMSPEYIYDVKDDSVFMPDAKAFGFAFVPRQALPGGAALPYNELMVSSGGGADGDSVKKSLEQAFDGRYTVVLTRDTQLSTAMFKNEIAQNRAIGGIFPIVFFLIAALAMLTTMTRLTSGQRLQIGTLKSLGFSRRKILRHYVSYGLWLGLAGGLVGLVTGPLAIPALLFPMQKTVYQLPEWKAAVSAADIAAVAVAVLCCLLSSWFACRRELGDVPAATLRPRAPKAGRLSRLEKSGLWRSLGFSAQWNLRDVLRNKVRSAMAVVGVVGCIMLLLWGLGLRDSIRAVTDRLYGELYTYGTKIGLEGDIEASALDALQARYPGQLLQEASAEIRAGDTVKSGNLTVVGDGSLYRFEDAGGRAMSLPDDGAAISYKMAELLGVAAGDTVAYRPLGEKSWQEVKIGAVYRSPIGQGLSFSSAAFEKTGSAMRPTALLTAGDVKNADGLPGVENVQSRQQLIDSFNAMVDSMQSLIAILILAALLLGAVVLYNLGALAFNERTRELATLKVLGFNKRKIRALLQTQNIWLTALGIVLGIPAGFFFIGCMLSTMSESSDFVTYVSPVSLAVSIAATFLLSFAVNLLMSRRVRSIDMVGALKSVE
ncbi:putative ABC transport system permease protein [Sporobacter termitidis DSM 10068]|uniref:Putative ABC transport system permease protein n=1 Tax=Sporobacter termitidis DSM 10068 TaxID=1123282 RepID=A0A1M5Z0V7_9FIRM|nr:ABC transporter permease [Sporobacter termitidis]SHI17869.1 putative ABC transport system permease protein [Sporobacter termitidis DSM 10068]